MKRSKSRARDTDKLAIAIKLKMVSEDYGDYFMIKTGILYHVISRLMCGFKTKDFNNMYVKEMANVKAGNFDVNKKHSPAKDLSTY